MQTLLDRMDRTSMYSGLEARVPFADHRIMEYVFNVPWSMKYQNGVEKRCCATPARICFRQNCCTAKKARTRRLTTRATRSFSRITCAGS